MRLLDSLDRFFSSSAALGKEDLVLVAFSGGPDSTALLWGLSNLVKDGRFRVSAAHLDHGLDPGSAKRARRATSICRELGVTIHTERIEVGALRGTRESLEACARRVRYGFLENKRAAVNATLLATAHHSDDQVETVLLRILFGSGLGGLSGIPMQRRHIVRPLLGFSRKELQSELDHSSLAPVQDPTNRAILAPRNRIRHFLIPRLVNVDPFIAKRLQNVASCASAVNLRLANTLPRTLNIRPIVDGATLSRGALQKLPAELRPYALTALLNAAGADYPIPLASQQELFRQLARKGRIGCDCGSGWRIVNHGSELKLYLQSPFVPAFAYTLEIPGEIEIPEIGVRIGLRQDVVEQWMFQGSSYRAGLSLPLESGDRVTIRNRRPGDQIRPLGCKFTRRLKDVLIDSKVPRQQRDSLPLVCVKGNIAWIPGITIDDRYRISKSDRTTWIVQAEGFTFNQPKSGLDRQYPHETQIPGIIPRLSLL